MKIIHQPDEDSLGHIINESLTPPHNYKRFNFIVAYAKSSGINQLMDNIWDFKKRGGVIEGVIGIDQKNTSYEALSILSSIGDMKIYHNTSSNSTFHPKLYMLFNDSKALVIVGSNNLTSGGLYTNYELSVLVELNLSNEEDRILFENILNIYEYYSEPPFAQSLTDDLLNILLEDDYINDESKPSIEPTIDKKRKKEIFPSRSIYPPKKKKIIRIILFV